MMFTTGDPFWDAGFAVAALAFAIAILEGVAVFALASPVFRIGFPAFRCSVAVPPPSPLDITENPMTIGDARVRWSGPSECVFRRRFYPFRFEINTPFPFKCSVDWKGNTAHITGRLPVGTLLFFMAWLLVWSGAGVQMISQSGPVTVLFTLAGWLFVGGIGAFSLKVERQRAQKMLSQLELFLSTSRPTRAEAV